ncbi:MAG: hypothetical protein ACAI35_04600 [Candidatus Methylacidiphilales bacterium]|nr:hypothetical protein [Candidatus Methylacidiphilales bacterium]
MTIITDDLCSFAPRTQGDHQQIRQESVLNLFVEILAPARPAVSRTSASPAASSSLRFHETARDHATAQRHVAAPRPRTAVRTRGHSFSHAAFAPPAEYTVRADLDSPPDIASQLRPDPAGIGAESLQSQPELPLRYRRRQRHFTPKVRSVWSGPPRLDDIFTLSDRHNIAEHVRRTDHREAA